MPRARLVSQPLRMASTPIVGKTSTKVRARRGPSAPAQSPKVRNCDANTASSPWSSRFRAAWNATSSPKTSASSGANDVQPTERSNATSKTTRRVMESTPSTESANAVATAHTRSPFSKDIPAATSVVSDRAASTSATRIFCISAS